MNADDNERAKATLCRDIINRCMVEEAWAHGLSPTDVLACLKQVYDDMKREKEATT